MRRRLLKTGLDHGRWARHRPLQARLTRRCPEPPLHFLDGARPAVVAAIESSGLRALVHPLTDDDLADHTTLAHWIGEPVELDVSVLDPPGHNQGVERFGKTDF